MNKSYSFTLDTEPSEEQLDGLMLAVLEDVKSRASKAEEKFKNLQLQALKQSLEIWERKQAK
jgi:hypothetical protein